MSAPAAAVAGRAPSTLRDVVALTKPRVTALVLATTAGGLALAPGTIDATRAVLALAATALVVGAANALNCWWERDADRHMARTRDRPLPAGRLRPRVALTVGLALAAVSLPAFALAINPVTTLLAAIALSSYVLVYTPLKQRSPLALAVGAIPGAIPPLLGWTAVTGHADAPGVALFGILFLWQLPHFLAIALYRLDDYARAGFKTTPVVRGERAARVQIVLYTLALVPVTLLPWLLGVSTRAYGATAAILGAAFLVEALRGLRAGAGRAWARRLFLASIVYLTVLFAALIVFKA